MKKKKKQGDPGFNKRFSYKKNLAREEGQHKIPLFLTPSDNSL